MEGVNWKNNKTDDNPSEQQFNHEKNRAYSDQCTAFISNLHPTVDSTLCLFIAVHVTVTDMLCYCRQIMSIFVISSVMLVELLPFASYMTNSQENQGYQITFSLSF